MCPYTVLGWSNGGAAPHTSPLSSAASEFPGSLCWESRGGTGRTSPECSSWEGWRVTSPGPRLLGAGETAKNSTKEEERRPLPQAPCARSRERGWLVTAGGFGFPGAQAAGAGSPLPSRPALPRLGADPTGQGRLLSDMLLPHDGNGKKGTAVGQAAPGTR